MKYACKPLYIRNNCVKIHMQKQSQHGKSHTETTQHKDTHKYQSTKAVKPHRPYTPIVLYWLKGLKHLKQLNSNTKHDKNFFLGGGGQTHAPPSGLMVWVSVCKSQIINLPGELSTAWTCFILNAVREVDEPEGWSPLLTSGELLYAAVWNHITFSPTLYMKQELK